VNQNESSMANTLTLLGRLKEQMPELWGQAEVVGHWVWLEFNTPPLREIRVKLKGLGFHWNHERRCWQHPCGIASERSRHDPKDKYPVVSAPAMEIKETAAVPRAITAKEYKVVALRECPLPEQMRICDTPDTAADYWRLNVATNPYFKKEKADYIAQCSG
jgi:hypothetical protein